MENAIFHAFSGLLSRLIDDSTELRRRIDRRRATIHLPRAVCLAIRANDTRLGETSPDDREPGARHELTLTRDLVQRLCNPVQLPPRQLLVEAAQRLGVTRTGLLPARVNGVFDTHHVEGLGAYWGKPRPLLSASQSLNPAVRGFNDPLGVYLLPSLLSRLARDMTDQKLVRIPRYYAREFPDTDQLHPEHPAVDPPARKRRSLALPKPPPDFVWYKWKGDVYMGYDWRSPAHVRHHEKRQRRLALARAAAKRRRVEHPPPSRWSGSLKFRGWQWLCPCCNRRVQVLFLPIPPRDLATDWARMNADEQRRQDHAEHQSQKRIGRRIAFKDFSNRCPSVPHRWQEILHAIKSARFPAPAVEGFACEKCHRIRRWTQRDGWNDLVRWLSGGLLFGHEVARSDPSVAASLRGFVAPKLSYHPRPNREPSKRRGQIERMLLDGMPFGLIAALLKRSDGQRLSKGTVLWHAQQIYKQHNVRTLAEFLSKHGKPKLTEALRGAGCAEIRRRILAGQSVAQISAELNVPRMMIYNQRQQMRKKMKLADGRKGNRVGGINRDRSITVDSCGRQSSRLTL